MSDQTVRRKMVLVHPSFWQDLLTHGTEKTEMVRGLPEGARFVRGFYDGQKNQFGLIFEHEDWEPVEDNQEYPILMPIVKTIRIPVQVQMPDIGIAWSGEG